MRVYNLYGRRDNKYKARIKILVHELGAEKFKAEVEAEYARSARRPPPKWKSANSHASRPISRRRPSRSCRAGRPPSRRRGWRSPAFARWATQQPGGPQGGWLHHRQHLAEARRRHSGRRHGGSDAPDGAIWPKRYSFDELRVSHAQNIVLPHVRKDDVFAVWQALEAAGSRCTELWPCRRHHRLPRPRLLRAGHSTLDPHRPVDLAQVRRHRAARKRSASSRSISRAASMPAATIMSATSASSASTRRARNSTRSRLAAPPPRTPRSARSSGRASRAMRWRMPSTRFSRPISKLREPGEEFLAAYRRVRRQALQGGSLCRCLRTTRSVRDTWLILGNDDALPASGRRDRAFRAAAAANSSFLARRSGKLGVVFANVDRAEALATFLPRLSVIVLHFPAFNDGRAYSLARQLREIGYRGELRATGNVLPDQLQFMLQVGFDAFEIGDRFPLAGLAVRLEADVAGLSARTLPPQRRVRDLDRAPH